MKRRFLTMAAVATMPLISAGCTTTGALDGISDPLAGFTTVAARAESVTGKKTVWVQSSEEARTVSERVKRLVQKKTIGPD
ncbi:MAG: TolC family protein, partial [Mesorhizobium sp.]